MKAYSDPRDNIFAILSICSPVDIPIDYNASTKCVFILATREIISKKNLDVILLSPRSDQVELAGEISKTAVPTLVPRFVQRLSDGSLVLIDCFEQQYDTAGLLDRQITFEESEILEVHGYFLGKVTQVHRITTTDTRRGEDLRDIIFKFASRLRFSNRPEIQTAQAVMQMFHDEMDPEERRLVSWQTMVMDIYRDGAGYLR
jgi:hypothetical protein